MLLKLRVLLREMFNRNSVFQSLALIFCLLFGMTMLLSTQSAGDGVWFWYSTFLGSGKLLYADMHLALQPLFVLETRVFMAVLGNGWLVSKIPAVIHLIAYCIALLLLVRQSDLTDAQKAILLCFAFFTSISFEAYRFDDYHVLTDCFQLYSLVALLHLPRVSSSRTVLLLSALLGVFSGLAITTRLNDGAALLLGVILAIVCLVPSQKLLSLALLFVAAALTVVLVVRLTGDSFNNYATYSIFKAAGSKGGAGNVLAYPFHVPINTFRWLQLNGWHERMIPYAFVAAFIWAFLLRPLTRRRGRKEFVLAAIGIALIVFRYHRMYFLFKEIDLLPNLAGVAVLLAYAVGVLVLALFLWWLAAPANVNRWDRRSILLLIPLGQLASSSMSSGGSHLGLYGPAAIFILILVICPPIPIKAEWPRDCVLALAALLICCTVSYRFVRPYSWHTYAEQPLFTGRTWYKHSQYGWMVIDRDLLQMIQPVCEQIKGAGSDNELLSLPFSYSNYFCSVPPWRGYVQTFFDTSSKQTIQTLMDQLQTSPPRWIFYQRQIHTMRAHEIQYNQGNPLQHRYLDQMVTQKITQGAWQIVYTSDYGEVPGGDNRWYLIRTR